MKFVWDNGSADIGVYDLYLYDEDKKLEHISITDNTNEWRNSYDKDLRVFRDYAYEVHYCCGFSMQEGFDRSVNRNKFGYNGIPTHALEDIKRWCENYLAQRYLRGYYNTLKRLDEMKRRAEWFESRGFKLEEENK